MKHDNLTLTLLQPVNLPRLKTLFSGIKTKGIFHDLGNWCTEPSKNVVHFNKCYDVIRGIFDVHYIN